MAQAWTAEARRWLQDIYDYVAADNEEAAHRTVLAIHERAEILLTFPEIGYRYRQRPEIRVLRYGHYRIAYLITPKRDVEVLGVFHGALDMGRYLASPG